MNIIAESVKLILFGLLKNRETLVGANLVLLLLTTSDLWLIPSHTVSLSWYSAVCQLQPSLSSRSFTESSGLSLSLFSYLRCHHSVCLQQETVWQLGRLFAAVFISLCDSGLNVPILMAIQKKTSAPLPFSDFWFLFFYTAWILIWSCKKSLLHTVTKPLVLPLLSETRDVDAALAWHYAALLQDVTVKLGCAMFT